VSRIKILIIEKYDAGNDYIERYVVYFGKDEGEYYINDYLTGKKGIRAKCRQLRNGVLDYYDDWSCTGELTKKNVIMRHFGGNGWAEGYIPDITVKDLEENIIWTAEDYMHRHNLTKLDGGCENGEKCYNDIYTKQVTPRII
jgi:hypothetical protein